MDGVSADGVVLFDPLFFPLPVQAAKIPAMKRDLNICNLLLEQIRGKKVYLLRRHQVQILLCVFESSFFYYLS